MSEPWAEIIRFGLFELDVQNRELRKRGLRLRVETKPLQVLELLVARPGEVVTRKQMQQTLWPDTHVAFEYSLNTAVNKLRAALGDSAESPRFIETIARRGYRFIGAVRSPDESDSRHAARDTTRPVSRTASATCSLAVLPFQNMSGQAELEYISDGLCEAVIRRVSQIPGVRVMAWSTVMRHKGRDIDALAVGRELGVSSVLVGRVLAGENNITMNLDLVDVEDGWQIWGHEYLRVSSEIQTLPEAIAKELAGKLRRGSPDSDKHLRLKRHTQNAEAYIDYLHGRHYWHQLSPDALPKSVGYFESAIQKDPEFALAQAAMAEAYILYAFIGILHPREALSLAQAAVAKALEIDDELPEANASFGNVVKLREHDWATAERAYLRCLELDPNNVIALRGFGNLLAALGRNDEAKLQIEKAQQIDPLSLVLGIDAAWNFYMAREYEESLRQARKADEMQSDSPAATHLMGMALTQLGMHPEAIEKLRKSGERSGGHYAAESALAYVYAISGQEKQSQRIVMGLQKMAEQRYVSPFCMAMAHAGLGEMERALEQIEKAFAEDDVWTIWLAREPRLDSLRAEPRFKEMLERMKLDQ